MICLIGNWYIYIYIIVWMDLYTGNKSKKLHREEGKYGCTYWEMILCFIRTVWCVFIACGCSCIAWCIQLI
jgi:hypothetical protein